MADEAFALSPISARATQPREEDYEAISDAFMETSRGRWFLTEYAKRNRNADTRMVLDAVARIEENLNAQKQPVSDNGLAEALAAITSAVGDAKASVSAVVDGLALQETLAPVAKGARVIREIAWRLREIGADSRICDLIDSQVSVIEAGCGQLASASPGMDISAAFDLIAARIRELGGDEAAPMPSPAPSNETPAGAPDTADDEAILDMVALEMSAADPFDDDDPGETSLSDPPLAAAETTARMPEPVVMPAPPPTNQPPAQPSLAQPSLGSSLIASGIVRRPKSASDPLAPIRRMSQAEKIALFS
jgi:hypothetical protein